MPRSLLPLLLLGFALQATPANAQLGRLVDRARDAAGRTVNQAADRAGENASASASEGTANAAHPERAEVEAAAETLDALWDQHYGDFADPGTSGFDYDRVDRNDWNTRAPEWLAALETAEAILAQAQPHMQVLHAHLGNDPSIGNGLHRLGIESDGDYAYDSFYRELEKVAKFRRDAAQDAANEVQRTMAFIRESDDLLDAHFERVGEMQETVVLAQQLDPNNEALHTLRAELAGFEGEMQAQRQAQIEAARWPGHASGAPSNLASGVLAYFRDESGWATSENQETILAIAVRGGWQPAKHNLLGQVVQWRLPIVLATTKPAWRDMGAARMFELSVLAQEDGRQSPPWVSFWVGDSGFISLDRVPGQ